jgi:manganese transport protein
MIVAILYGERGTAELLVLSQVILSLQLSFAVVPLVRFTSNRLKMGRFVNPRWVTITAWAVAVIIIALNAYLLWNTLNWLG